ncbi:ParB N-terminal domain-containing protein [Candidatus Microgenomates bacterium]|jgi:ParB/RepB/Spo0J family partition protein|nr:ParB N-terminal domain-containing protein [Candidatus Microgenomates bacterium]
MADIGLQEKITPEKVELPKKDKIAWKLFEVKTEDLLLAENIRPIDPFAVEDLANSISEIGQLQPCIGDVVETESGNLVRVIAGQHRYYAVKQLIEAGEDVLLLIRVANRQLSEEQVLSIQMAENLQNKMKAEEDAKIIHSYWLRCRQLYGDENVSIAFLSRKLGRSSQKISEAIKFVEGLSPKIQELVQKGVLHYSTAVLLAKMDNGSNKGSDYDSEQVRTAVFLISQGYNKEEAKRYLDKRSKEVKAYTEPLFSGEVWKELKKNGYRMAIKDQSSKEGRTASGWFVRMIKTVSLLDDPTKTEFSEAIEKAVGELDISMDDFKNNLQALGVKL